MNYSKLTADELRRVADELDNPMLKMSQRGNLILAAPEMYEALTELPATVFCALSLILRVKIDKALAKAEGK